MTRGLVVLGFLGIMAVGIFAVPDQANAWFSVNFGFYGPPPAYEFHAPPPLVVVPRTSIYYVPNTAVDVFFYRDHWYRPYRGGWYIAGSYNGPWTSLAPRRVPYALLSTFSDYRHHDRSYYYDDSPRKHWKQRQREGRWDD